MSNRRIAFIRVLAIAALAGGAQQASACSYDDFVGSVCLDAATYCPKNTMEADGRELQIAKFAPVFALLGTTYGGNGITTFKLPKLAPPLDGLRYCVVIEGVWPPRPDSVAGEKADDKGKAPDKTDRK